MLIHVALQRTRDWRGITFAWQRPRLEKEAVTGAGVERAPVATGAERRGAAAADARG